MPCLYVTIWAKLVKQLVKTQLSLVYAFKYDLSVKTSPSIRIRMFRIRMFS